MTLFEEHKAERRARILAAARELIAERGYEGLTMRDLARASRVSVPTLYNLFGGKRAILLGELEHTFSAVVAAIANVRDGSFVERVIAVCNAGNADVLAVPRYSRELVLLFLTSAETTQLRRDVVESYTDLMAELLRDGRRAGDIEPWIDPVVLSHRMFAHYSFAMIEWARGEIDADGFRAATRFGMCAMLAGVARGGARRRLAAELRRAQAALAAAPRPKTRARKGDSR